ncbi:hypothetical protein [Phenylobacterium sp.]|uniref:hypothetical protein n=1 Tax=Phenylobacterium sp. TaxID=1871053 RepID=UPI002DEF2A48|nr:hypothetical protein [Phenylobacterium sp.]
MKLTILTASLAIAAIAGVAEAQDASRSDMRCVVAFSRLLQTPAYKDAAGAGMFYYIGRLDGREPGLDLAAAMRREIANMATADYTTEAQRCGAELKARNEAVKAAGEAVKAGR